MSNASLFMAYFRVEVLLMKRRPVSVIVLILFMLGVTLGVVFAADIGSHDNLAYTEQEGWVYLDSDVTVTGGTDNFIDGYIDIQLAAGTSYDQLRLVGNGGSLTVVGSAVYWDGTRIGTVDATRNGQNGNPLRISFSGSLPNASFEDGFTGWSVDTSSNQMMGQSWAEGPTVGTQDTDPTYDDQSDGQCLQSLDTTVVHDGTYSLKLEVTGHVHEDCGTAHCPSVVSSPFSAANGDTIEMYWNAAQTSDYYDVFGFLVNGDTGVRQRLFHQTGSSTGGWVPLNTSVGTACPSGTCNNLYFEFLNGTFDNTCGQAIGSYLYIDGISVVLSTNPTAAMAQEVARHIQYQNTSDNPPASQNYTLGVQDTGSTNTSIRTINYTRVNDMPYNLTLSNSSINENLSIGTTIGTFSVSDLDTGLPHGDPHSYSFVSGDTSAFSIVGDQLRSAASYNYELDTSYTVTVRATDQGGGTTDNTFTITVIDVNEVPTAVNDDLGTTNEDTTVSGTAPGLMANDTDPDNEVDPNKDPLSVSAYDSTSVQGASVTVNANGSYSYNPTAATALQALAVGESVSDSFNYTVQDSAPQTDSATVSIEVTGVNDPVYAVADTGSTDEDTALTVNAASGVLANDTDVDTSDTHTVISYDSFSVQGAHVTMNPDGSYTYDPVGVDALDAIAGGDNLVDTFTYTVTDPHGSIDTGTVSITVVGIDDPPILTGSDSVVTWVEPGPAVVIDPGIQVYDIDGPNLVGATVSIGTNFVAGEDGLGIQGQTGTSGTYNGIAWSYNGATGILTFTGSAPAADYQVAMRHVTYYNNSIAGSMEPRAVQFSIATQLANPDNNHYYEFVSDPSITWTAANSAASGMTLFGLQGYLTTVSSQAENDFISAKLQGEGWMGASDAALEGTWQWVTGPEAGTTFCIGNDNCVPVGGAYTHWDDGEPNDADNEDYGHFLSDGYWNDYAYNNAFIDGFVVEYGGMESDPVLYLTADATVNVIFGNDPPVNVLPMPQQTIENTSLTLSAANGNQLSTTDSDVQDGELLMTLQVSNGTLTLGGTSGLGGLSGNGTSLVSFTGTLTNVNAALNGAVFTPATNFYGLASIEITANDQGNTGPGGAMFDIDTLLIEVVQQADLSVTKTGATAATAGGQAGFSITVSNAGPGVARDVDLLELVPDGTSIAGISADNPNFGNEYCSLGGACYLGEIPSGSSATVVVTLDVDADFSGTFVNGVEVSTISNDPDRSNNLVTATGTAVSTSADLAITKADLQDPVSPTDGLLYEIVVKNNGPSDAQSVQVVDTLDSDVTFAGASPGCSESAGEVTCDLGAVAVGESRTLIIAVDVNDIVVPATLNNSATVSAATTDPAAGNNTATAATSVQDPVGPEANLNISKTQDSADPNAGETVDFVIQVTNAGPQPATNVMVYELVPAGTSVAAMIPSAGYCSQGGVCNLGTIDNGASATVTVTLLVDADFSGTSFVNSAYVTSDLRDSDVADNLAATASGPTSVSHEIDLVIEKTLLTPGVAPGGVALYQVVIYNDSTADVDGVKINDAITTANGTVSAVTPVEATGEGAGLTIPAGGHAVMLVSVVVSDSTAPGDTVTNQAAIAVPAGYTDTDTENNVDTASLTVGDYLPGADVEVVSAAWSEAPVPGGAAINLTVNVRNNGPAPAEGVELVNAILDASYIVEGIDAPAAWNCDSGLACTRLDPMPAAAVETLTFSISFPSDAHLDSSSVSVVSAVSADNPDGTAANNTKSDSEDFAPTVDLAVEKTLLTPDVAPGGIVLYEVVVTNNGPSDVDGLWVSDVLGSTYPLAFLESSSDSLELYIPAGQTRDALLSVKLSDTETPGNELHNTAEIDGAALVLDGYVVTGVLTDTAAIMTVGDYLPPADMDATSTVVDVSPASGSPVVAGLTYEFQLEVTNNNSNPAEGVIVHDLILGVPGWELVDYTPAGEWVCSSGLTCSRSNPMPQGTETVGTFVISIPADASTGENQIEHVFSVSASNPDLVTANNSGSYYKDVSAEASLNIDKSGSASVMAGDSLGYTIVVGNDGPSDAQSVQVTDSLPAALDNINASVVGMPASACSLAGNDLTCNLGVMAPGESATIYITADVSSGTSEDVTNTATVSSPTDPSDSSDSHTTTFGTSADLELEKSATSTANAGETVDYQISVTNHGPSDANNVVVTDTVPAGMAAIVSTPAITITTGGFESGTLGGWTVGGTGAVEALQPSNLSPAIAAPEGGWYALLSDGPGNLSGSSADVDGNGTPDADISTLTYNFTISEEQAPAVLHFDWAFLTDEPPSTGMDDFFEVRLNSDLILSGSATGAILTSPYPDIATNGTPYVVSSAGATNGSSFGQGTNNFQHFTLPVASAGSYTLQFLVADQNLSFPLRDSGLLLDNVEIVTSSTIDCQEVEGDLVCTLGTVPAERTVEFPLTLLVESGIEPGSSLENVATVTSDETDPDPVNNTDDADSSIVGLADLTLTKNGPATVTAGEAIAYTIEVENLGPSTAQSVEVMDILPAGVSLTSATVARPGSDPTACAGGGTVCQVGDLAVGESATVTVNGIVNADVADSAELVNEAVAFSVTLDENTENNSDTASTSVGTSADLSVVKVDMTDPVIAGEMLLYQIRVTNDGPSDAQNVVVTDDLPTNTYFRGASDVCSESGGTVTCEVDTLAAGEDNTLFVHVMVDEGLADPTLLSNSASVTSDTSDPVSGNDSDTETTTVVQSELNPTDLQITKAGNPSTVIAGQNVTYGLVVTNNGPAPATNVEVVDVLPDGLTVLSATPSQGTCSLEGVCELGDISVGASATVSIIAQVDSDQTGTLSNHAYVSASNPDTILSNNTSNTVVTTIDVDDTLSITKEGPEAVSPDDGVLYHIIVSNNGPSDASGVMVVDTLPTQVSEVGVTAVQLENVAASASQGSCTASDTQVLCTLGDLPAGETAHIHLYGYVISGAAGDMTNLARVTSADDPTGVSDSTTASVVLTADLAIQKSATPTVNAGEDIEYTLTVINNGPSDASDVVVTDQLPAGVTLLDAEPVVIINPDFETQDLTGWTTGGTAQVEALRNTHFLPQIQPPEGDVFALLSTGPGDQFATNGDVDSNGSADYDGASLSTSFTVTADQVPLNLNFQWAFLSSEVPPPIAAGSDDFFMVQLNGQIILDGSVNGAPRIPLSPYPDTEALNGTPYQVQNAGATNGSYFDDGRTAFQGFSKTITEPGNYTLRFWVFDQADTIRDSGLLIDNLTITPACTQAAGEVTCTIDGLAAGASAEISFVVTTDDDLEPGSSLENVATVSSETADNDSANNLATADTSIISEADLTLSKSDSPDPVLAGETLTYTIVVENQGPSVAQSVVVVDDMPAELALVSATATKEGALCEDSTCQLGDLAVGEVVTVTMVTTVDSGVADGTVLENTATVFTDSDDPNTGGNSQTVGTTVNAEVDVWVEKSGTEATEAGDSLSYTIVVGNDGPSDALSVVVTDTLDANLINIEAAALNMPDACSLAGNELTCDLGTLAPDEAVTIEVTADVASNAYVESIENTAYASTATADTDAENDSSSHTTTISTSADLELNKTATATVNAGEPITYELTVTNHGPSDARNVVITDTLPAGVVWQSGCAHDAGVVTCSVEGDLATGASESFIIVVDSDPALEPGASLENTAIVVSDEFDPDEGNNQANADTSIIHEADLVLSKSDSPDPVLAGEILTYTLVVENQGPSDAESVVVVDDLPAELALVSASVTKEGALCEDSTCQLGDLAVGEVVTMTLVTTVDPSVADGTVLENTATAFTDSVDPVAENNSDSIATTVNAEVDVWVEKSGTEAAAAGESLAYTIVVGNVGPSDALSVVVTDTLDANLSNIEAAALNMPAACSLAGNELTCVLGTLAPDETVTIEVTADVASNAYVESIENTAYASTATADTVSENDSSSHTTAISTSADLELNKTATPTVVAGELVTYELTVTNHGPSDARNVEIIDTLPAGVVWQSGCSHDAGVVTCSVEGDLAAGASTGFTIVVQVVDDLEPGMSLENTALVSSDEYDPNAANNEANADTSVVGVADLALFKAGSEAVLAGEAISYTIIVENQGPSVAQSVVVRDAVPEGVALTSATLESSLGGSVPCSLPVCEIGDVQVGEVVTITLTGGVAADTPAGTLVNQATVLSVSVDPNSENDSDTAETTVSTEADLSVTKVDLMDPVGPAEGLLYEIVVANDGPSDAHNVVITDTLGENLTFVSASTGCVGDPESQEIICTVEVLPAGESVDLLLTALVGDVESGTIVSNQVVVTADTTDPNLDNNLDLEETEVQQVFEPSADLSITKVADQESVLAGELVTYTLTITNAGPSTGTNAQVLELIPSGTTLVSATVDNPDFGYEFCTLSGVCYLGMVTPDTEVTITMVLRVNADFGGNSVTNIASVTADQIDYMPGNNITSETVSVSTQATLSLTKVDMVDPVIAGEQLVYQIVARNLGPSDATGVVITDTVPANTTFAGASDVCTHDSGLITCAIGRIKAGSEYAVSVQVTVDRELYEGTLIDNTAYATLANGDGVSAEATTTVVQTALNPTDLSITKNADPSEMVVAGELITYTLVVTNNGPAPAANVQVMDLLPANVTVESITTSQGSCQDSAICNLGDMEVEATAQVTIVALVNSDRLDDIVNRAHVSGSSPDLNLEDNEDEVVTTVAAAADLEVTKTAMDAVAIPGESASYEIVVRNLGPSDARGVVLTDLLPIELMGTRFSLSQGSCLGNQCSLGILPAGEQVVVTLEGTVDPVVTDSFTNTVSIASETADPTSENDGDTAMVGVVPTADLALNKEAPAAVNTDQLITYTLTIHNAGPSDATNVVVTDTLPEDVSSLSMDTACSEDAFGQITCSEPYLPAGATVAYQIVVSVNTDVPTGTSVENEAVVESDAVDPNPMDNWDTADTSVVSGADLVVSKTGPEEATAGEALSFTIVVTNAGPSVAQSVTIDDYLPTQLNLESVDVERTNVGPTACALSSCQVGDMAIGEVVTMTVHTTVDLSVREERIVVNQASATADTPDHDLSNNSDTHTVLLQPRLMLYLPLIIRPESGLPDLVGEISLDPSGSNFDAGDPVQVEALVTNQGIATAGAFWVDFYINPSPAPTAPNLPWQNTCNMSPCYGISWQVSAGLQPGNSVMLTSVPSSYDPEQTVWPGSFAAGTRDLYLYVDSWNPGADVGAVLESDEENNRSSLRNLSVTGANPADVATGHAPSSTSER